MKKYLIIIMAILLGCSNQQFQTISYDELSKNRDRDYIDHLASSGADFLKGDSVREVHLTKESFDYLEQIHERIMTSNEILLSKDGKPEFHVIKNKIPFLFSLPHAQYFFSSGLMEHFLKSEEIFVAAFSAEILKSNRNIYEKRMLIPLGFYNVEKMLQLTKLKPETKYRINEWSYFVIKRAGFDPSAYLNWIQVQNRNTLDFSLYIGDSVSISKEEYIFKNFMSKQGIAGFEKKINEANSSKAFYKLINNIVSGK